MKKRIYIEGMNCGHCVGHVERALKELEGVEEVKVDLQGKNAVVEYSEEITDEQIREAIDDAGYDVVCIEEV